jgi:hypothetical protein
MAGIVGLLDERAWISTALAIDSPGLRHGLLIIGDVKLNTKAKASRDLVASAAEVPVSLSVVSYIPLLVYVCLEFFFAFVLVNYWRAYIGVHSANPTSFLGEVLYLFFGQRGGLSFKDIAVVLVEVVMFLHIFRKICEFIVNSWRHRRWVALAMSIACRFDVMIKRSRTWGRRLFSLFVAIGATCFFVITCHMPGRQLFEFLIFPSWIIGTLISDRASNPNQVAYWVMVPLTWFCVGYYLLSLIEILVVGFVEEEIVLADDAGSPSGLRT